MIYTLQEMQENYNGTLAPKQKTEFRKDTDEDAVAFANYWAKQVTDDRLVVVRRSGESTVLAEPRGQVGIGANSSH